MFLPWLLLGVGSEVKYLKAFENVDKTLLLQTCLAVRSSSCPHSWVRLRPTAERPLQVTHPAGHQAHGQSQGRRGSQ